MEINNWGIDGTWTLFLDRDGVINRRIMDGYVTRVDEFEFLPGAVEAFQVFQKFNRIVVVTNQQGIGKGLMTEFDLLEIHLNMTNQIHLAGGRIDKCLFAPNLRGAEDDLRKPGRGMADMAKMIYPEIDFNTSIMVGDTDSDIQFGKNLGMKTVRVKTEVETISVTSDVIVDSLYEFSQLIKR